MKDLIANFQSVPLCNKCLTGERPPQLALQHARFPTVFAAKWRRNTFSTYITAAPSYQHEFRRYIELGKH